MDYRIILGLTVLLICTQLASSQTCPSTISNCVECNANQCSTCATGFVHSSGTPRGCCRPGCSPDNLGFPQCNITTAVCTFVGECLDGYIGPTCTHCTDVIENCENCRQRSEGDIICSDCSDGFDVTSEELCCPIGCDACVGDVCSVCKAGYFLYADGCDTCGEYCLEPSDQTARCDSTTGECLYGCEAGWHGSTCNVFCDITNCLTCDYEEPNDRLFCIDCDTGYWGPSCEICPVNCRTAAGTTTGTCDQTGSCLFGCIDGWRGTQCDVRCDDLDTLQNCLVCARTDFECSVCATGYWGDTCQNSCNDKCEPLNSIPYCDIADGRCLIGCNPGYWSDDCSNACPNCASGVCNRDTGICTTEECAPGFFTSTCMSSCPVNCAPDPGTGLAFCDFENGGCTHGCTFNYYGALCGDECSPYCNEFETSGPYCNQFGGTCRQACKPGYYLATCTAACQGKCVDDTCDIIEGTCSECNKTLDQQGYLCPTGTCDTGNWGDFCNITCAGGEHCLNGICRRETGNCDHCIPYRWGQHCQKLCSYCSEGECVITTGVCSLSCIDGFYGRFWCENSCHDRCSVCERVTGQCITCDNGTFGQQCENDCSEHCYPSFNDIVTCSIDNGICHSEQCLPGYYGPTCVNQCNQNCAADMMGIVECNIGTGECSSGCNVGFYGPACDGECSSNCFNNNCLGDFDHCVSGCIDAFYGERCDIPCNSNCVNNTCSDDNGYCSYGCNVGFFGSFCDEVCNETCIYDTCDRESGECGECKKETPSFVCRSADCPNGYYDILCNETCPGQERCMENKCGRHNGTCLGCVADYYGDACEFTCANCQNGSCTQGNGACTEGCLDGYYGQKCENQCHDRCAICNRASGYCQKCEPASFGEICEFNCSTSCLPGSTGFITCSRNEGICDQGACTPGFYEPSCKTKCSQSCLPGTDGEITCNILSGTCDLGCQVGFYGLTCQGICSSQCLDSNCIDYFANCVNGCIDKFYGPLCDIPCDVGCVDRQCNGMTGICSIGCTSGQFGSKCEYGCLETCIDETCDRTSGKCSECMLPEPGYQCRSADCEVSKYGQFCDTDCIGGVFCLGSICDRYSGHCVGCSTGLYGEYCQSQCTECLEGRCNQTSGVCNLGCVPGHYGQNCEFQCHERCVECDRDSGYCDICETGTYGPVCEYNCSLNCLPDNNDRIFCSRDDGYCNTGECLIGFFTRTCEVQCNEHCVNFDCELFSGNCLQGCEDGWYGGVCSGECSTNCKNEKCLSSPDNCVDGCIPEYYGTRCNQPCPNNCYNDVCQDDGYCANGCVEYYYGDLCSVPCDETCTDKLCDRETGDCQECKKNNPGPLCRTAECPVGKYGLDCLSDCPSQHCSSGICDRASSHCISCVPGYYGDLCDQTCNTCRQGTTCRQTDGRCDVDCEDGYYGEYCLDVCTTCVSCDKNTGLCTECPFGKYGTQCLQDCSQACVPVDDIIRCDLDTGECESGTCLVGYWDLRCSSNCSSNCKKDSQGQVACDREDGRCIGDCLDRFYGTQCEFTCISFCYDKTCHRADGVCEECLKTNPSPNCPTALCPAGYFGAACDIPCASGCNETCDRDTEKCDGCKPGLFGEKCNSDCSGPNCYECEQEGGACLACKSGYYGQTCQFECGSCRPEFGTVQCDKDNGDCLPYECVPGFWGRTCTHGCNLQCLAFVNNISECFIDTGICKYGCKDTYFGSYCDGDCSPTCHNSLCIDSAFNCFEGCSFGFYGENCDLLCHENCVGGGCDEISGACAGECETGFYGSDCSIPCSSTCIDNKCDRLLGNCPECHEGANTGRPSFYCRAIGCDGNTFGEFCTTACPETCESTCDRYTGYCNSCDVGRYGQECENLCGRCAGNICEQVNGTCDTCQPGYSGDNHPNCNNECLHLGCFSCVMSTGECDVCNAGLYGSICDEECSEKCIPDQDGLIYCDKTNGNCDEEACESGYWNAPCDMECNLNCSMDDDGSRPCNFSTGVCDLGCEDTWYGTQCDERCSVNCKDQLCERNGECSSGCVPTKYGVLCELNCTETCNDNRCNQTTGECDECDKPYAERTPECRDADCGGNTFGDFCITACPETCESTCGRYTGYCDSCDVGRYGQECENLCGGCVGNICEQVNGTCDTCQPGYSGDNHPNCNNECLHLGCFSCVKSTGECDVCNAGLYGSICDEECSGKCIPDQDDGLIYCNKTSGNCDEEACESGYWNAPCDMECNLNCFMDDDDSRPCNFSTGACDLGCEDTWYGAQCDERCSVNCNDQLCERNGECSSGCVPTKYGVLCELDCTETCNDNRCNQTTGECNECDKPYAERTPECRDADCDNNTYGVFCEFDCLEACESTCNRTNGFCDSCDVGLYGSECESICGKCAGDACQQDSGSCGTCQAGWYGMAFPHCNNTCLFPGCFTCDKTEGTCDVCMSGKYGGNCDDDCRDTCQPNPVDDLIYCAKATGYCDEQSCLSGYWDAACDEQCNANCIMADDGSRPCDFNTGRCILGCEDTWYGDQCNFRCSDSCQNQLCERNGECITGCVLNKYGPECEFRCTVTCNNNTCNRTDGLCDECKKPYAERSPHCREADCVVGNHGLFCDLTCPDNCASSCTRYDSVCNGCSPGFHGDKCENDCTNCEQVTCDQNTAECDGNCTKGYYGDTCGDECLHTGCRSCLRSNGECINCKPELYGSSCQLECSDACPVSADGLIYCDKETGACTIGSCDPGFYGPKCVKTCPGNCRPSPEDDQTLCDFEDGSCNDGCMDEWYGSHCNFSCSVNCKGDVKLCARNGRCTEGCVNERYGDSCDSVCNVTCSDDTCDRITGMCAACPNTAPQCRDPDCPGIYHGLFCDNICSEFCQERKCGRYTGICNSCIADRWGNNCENTCGFCTGTSCDQFTADCPEGCDNGYYGSRCVTPCKHTGCQTCDSSGECLVCKQGLYGPNCDATCSTECMPSDVDQLIYCDKFTGDCDSGACIAGYHQTTCTEECGVHCGLDDNGAKPCLQSTGYCAEEECENTWYGQFCINRCPSGCTDLNCFRNGTCREGCNLGRYGDTCENSCVGPDTCNNGACDRNLGFCLECNKTDPTPLCRSADCPVGKHGTFCDKDCPANCADNVCDRDTGLCPSCKLGYWGSNCESTCFNCRDNACFQSDGYCEKDCKDGWYSQTCTSPCLHDGCQTCHIVSGECITCKIGLYGDEDCSQACERTCSVDADGDITCNKLTGACDTGKCIDGYYGMKCDQKCSEYCGTPTCGIDSGVCEPCVIGYYGQRCTGVCSTRCQNKDCVVSEDQCRQGCTTGYWGSRCETTCSSNCDSNLCDKDTGRCTIGCTRNLYWGDMCLARCNDNCIANKCSRQGYCTEECEHGFYGDQCENTCRTPGSCTDGTCDRESGNCAACFTEPQGNLCPDADCPTGKRGPTCEVDCTSDNCLYDQCHRDDDICITCPNGWWGDQCEKTCPNCKEGTSCFKTTGECIVSCSDGWYGTLCDSQCSPLCTSCERQNGDCVTCRAGRYGDQCTDICSPNCKETVDNGNNMIYCNKVTGACTEAECKANYWGQACDRTCGENCRIVGGQRLCGLLDGACVNGCIDTYYGTACERTCSDRCRNQLCVDFMDKCTEGCNVGYYGATCSGTCSTHCVGGTCTTDTGKCLLGCEPNYYGDRCDNECINTCLNGTCGVDGSCGDCKVDPIGPGCRVQVCPQGWYGPQCESECPGDYCLNNQCHRLDGLCSLGCLPNYYGELCVGRCNCDAIGTSECDQTDGTCICNNGYHGTRCDQTCSDGCIGFRCDRNGQCLDGCKPGRYGFSCANTCNTCFSSRCNSVTGNCEQGCVDGYHGIKCQLRCSENCFSCDVNTGQCLECLPQFYGLPACTQTCSINCEVPFSGRSCRQGDGACTSGCKLGFYGTQCLSSCGNCFQTGSCNAVTGECFGCQSRWWGTQCTQQCSDNCAKSGSQITCRQSDGRCDSGCDVGYYGPNCDSICSTRCVSSKCTSASSCTDGCVSPYYGKNTGCQNTCSNCRFETCSDIGVCDVTLGCKDGYYGAACTKACTSTCTDGSCDNQVGDCQDCRSTPKGPSCRDQGCFCKNGTCDRTDGSCACFAGYYGNKCENECGNCLSRACDTNGICSEGCVEGFRYSDCSTPCSENCGTCERWSGLCVTCARGLRGIVCLETCPEGCKRDETGVRACERDTGKCLDGCESYFYGNLCDRRCDNCEKGVCERARGGCDLGCLGGWYGSYCDKPCSEGCWIIDGRGVCELDTGKCLHGCKEGLVGDTCSVQCSATCQQRRCNNTGHCYDGCIDMFYGPFCEYSCPEKCLNQSCTVDGMCTGGCMYGFHGSTCNKRCYSRCTDGSCDIHTGLCEVSEDPIVIDDDKVDLTVGEIVGIAAACVGVILIFVTLLICCIFYRRKAHDMKNEIHLPSDVLERLSTHRSLHSTVSTNYPVARVVGDDEKDFVLF